MIAALSLRPRSRLPPPAVAKAVRQQRPQREFLFFDEA